MIVGDGIDGALALAPDGGVTATASFDGDGRARRMQQHTHQTS